MTISCVMIVKNEEKILARCLDSIRDLMDEIIIVDTGSSDKTKEIAAKYTDKIYDFAWTGDFSDARNFAFSKATMDYIYSADADEVLDDLVEYFGDSSDILGDTILHYAARTANETTIRRMLTFGLNRQALNNSGETPYDVAKRWNNKAGMELLK